MLSSIFICGDGKGLSYLTIDFYAVESPGSVDC